MQVATIRSGGACGAADPWTGGRRAADLVSVSL